MLATAGAAMRLHGATDGLRSTDGGKERSVEFTGNGINLQAALAAAISAAQKPMPGPDMLIRWKLTSVSGQIGGIAGLNMVTVVIEASR